MILISIPSEALIGWPLHVYVHVLLVHYCKKITSTCCFKKSYLTHIYSVYTVQKVRKEFCTLYRIGGPEKKRQCLGVTSVHIFV